MHVNSLFVQRYDYFFRTVELHTFALGPFTRLRYIIEAEHHVLGRHGDRGSVGRVQYIVRTEHQQLGLKYGRISEREMDCHLVTVEIGVERRTCQRVQLDCLSFDKFRLEGLDSEPVKRRGTVKQYRMPFHYIFEYIPDNRVFPVHNLLCRFDGLHNAPLYQFSDNEWFVKFRSHEFRQTALMHLQLRTDDDYRTGRIVHTFTEQVLTETSLFTFKAVGQRFQRPVGLGLDCIRFS